MLDNLLPNLPYESIGIITTVIVFLIAITALLAIMFLAVLAIWIRGFHWLSDKLFQSYQNNDQKQTAALWKLRMSGVCAALARLKFTKLKVVYNEAETIIDETTETPDEVKNAIK